jgi:hypothetical protein
LLALASYFVTVRVADFEIVFAVAVILTPVFAPTATVLTANVPVNEPAGITKLATEGLATDGVADVSVP